MADINVELKSVVIFIAHYSLVVLIRKGVYDKIINVEALAVIK